MISRLERLIMRGSVARIVLASLALGAIVAAVVFGRAAVLSDACSDLNEITRNINRRDGALTDFIAANILARERAATLARQRGAFAQAKLQDSIAEQYARIGDRFDPLPPPSC